MQVKFWRIKKKRCLNLLWLWQRGEKKRKSVYLCSLMPWNIFANYLKKKKVTWICCIKKSWHAAKRLISGILVLCDEEIEWKRVGSCINWSLPLVICAELTHYSHLCVNRGLKIISSSNKLCWCVFLDPLLLLNVSTLSVMFQERSVYYSTNCPCSLPMSSS